MSESRSSSTSELTSKAARQIGLVAAAAALTWIAGVAWPSDPKTTASAGARAARPVAAGSTMARAETPALPSSPPAARQAALADSARLQTRPARQPSALTPPREPATAPTPPAAQADAVPENIDAVEARWADEPEDQAWTRDATTRLVTMLADQEVDGQVMEVSCRTTLCMASLKLGDISEAEKLKPDSATAERWIRFHAEQDGVVLDVFTGRKR